MTKKTTLTILILVCLFLGVSFVSAQVLNLNSPESLASPVATKLDLRNINIDVTNKLVTVTYRFLAADDKAIPKTGGGQVDRVWECRDACFDDTFSFVIRTQDAGTSIGKGLRALIWSKMRPAILTGANNATLP